MTRNFHRWEIDPFFSAAEEVQDSTDRLESVYRTWMHMKSTPIGADEGSEIEFRRRELSIALGTAKWQLEEFERAVTSIPVDDQQHTGDDDSARHKQFIDALRNQIVTIEQSLLNSNDSRDLKVVPVVNLDQVQKDELALFLCASRESSHDSFRKLELFPSMDGKAYEEEAPCTTSESLRSKTGMSDCVSTSASCSETTSNRVDFLKGDVYYKPQNSSASQKHFSKLHKKNTFDLLSIKIEQVNQTLVDPEPELSCVKEKRSNVHHKSTSLATGMSPLEGIYRNKGSGNHQNNGVMGLQFWSRLTKNRYPLIAELSPSSVKRYKDGDISVSTDIEKTNGSKWHGGSSFFLNSHPLANGTRGENTYYIASSEVSCMSRWMQHGFSSSRLLQLASAILVTLALLGISFHVSA